MREACDFLRDSPGHHLAFALGAHHCLGLRPRGCRRGLCCRSCLGGSLTLLLSRRRGRSRWETTLGGMRLCRLLRSAAAPTNCPGSAMILCSENTQRLADTCDRRHVPHAALPTYKVRDIRPSGSGARESDVPERPNHRSTWRRTSAPSNSWSCGRIGRLAAAGSHHA